MSAATAADAARIAEIHNEGVASGLATFDCGTCGVTDVEAWLAGSVAFVVAGDGERLAGFARAAPYSDSCVDRGIAEHSVYVAADARGRGLGRELLEALAQAAEAEGIHKLTARILDVIAPSLAGHRAGGFYEVGFQRRHGRRAGRWADCVLVERLLGPAADPPGSS